MPTEGIVFFSTADPDHNTAPPAGSLAGSGWELQGDWGIFLGTPISDHHFITVKHIGGQVGDIFRIDQREYRTVRFHDDPQSDLRIWEVAGRFSAHARLYSSKDEVGRHLVVFGRGTQRGEPVVVESFFDSELKGWHWGTPDQRKRWGENRVDTIINDDAGVNVTGSNARSNAGPLLRIAFNARGEPNEAHATNGDSAGGVFIHDGTSWKLAGINYAIDGPYNLTDTGPGFPAAVFDEGGLYKGGEGRWSRSAEQFLDKPGGFYAIRISSRLSWIESVLALPVTESVPVLQSSVQVAGPYQDTAEAQVNQAARQITVPVPRESQFYRLHGTQAFRITGLTKQNGQLHLTYE